MSEITTYSGAEDPQGTSLATLDDVVAVVSGASSSADFNPTYDRAVDVLEDYSINRAIEAIQQFDVGESVRILETASGIRAHYLALLEEVAAVPDHPVRESLDAWRDFALRQADFIQWLTSAFRAFELYRSGKVAAAISALDQLQLNTPNLDDVPEMQLIARSTAESLGAAIRYATRDWSGARASYERAAAYMEMVADTNREAAEFGLHTARANAAKMHHAQLVDSNDFAGASEAARQSADEFASAADAAEQDLPVLYPMLLAWGIEQEANVEQAQAEVALERQDWATAEGHMQGAQRKYQEASRATLRSSNPYSQMFQETFLNTSLQWHSQFRRRLQRESEQHARYERLQRDLDDLYAAVRGALAPAGIVVENKTEMVTSVQQQVEVSTRVETNLRDLLRGVPDALRDSGLPADQVENLSREAIGIADSPETGPSFLDRVKRFGAALGSAATVVGQVAAPVLQILNALAVIH